LDDRDKKDCVRIMKGNYIGRIVKDRYRVLRELQPGGDEYYFICEDITRRGFVDMRVIPCDYKDAEAFREAEIQFRNQLDVLCRLEHTGLPQIIEGFTEKLEMFIITDHTDGATLEDKLKRKNQLPVGEVLTLSREILSILDYLHGRYPPVIFRDLKPCNILVKNDGHVQLVNFGLARTYKPFKDRDTIVRYSKGYAAPEQYGGKGQTDGRADIYSFGVTLHQMLTGSDPIKTPFKLPLLENFRSDLGPMWQVLISRATNIRQDSRYQTIREFVKALDEVAAGRMPEGVPAESTPVAPKENEARREAESKEMPVEEHEVPLTPQKEEGGKKEKQRILALVIIMGVLLLVGILAVSLEVLKGYAMIVVIIFASFLFLGIMGYFIFLRRWGGRPS
jgi:serine/threonine protein kinase